ncbi:uncharacterized protein LOC117766982 [Hippoglossus hippoglossus]|uniref:uncharacterized protein LOC117766982 n=1 Tax=Hippoglossus hippoglossus TaxID=8267 RepID=UPI00148E7CE0|nr:uncharacterized protein LOC117766982 [Hippoglossus hippoglossus]
MMRMSGRVTSCCAALFLALASVSAVERLNSIDDLKKIYSGQSVPKHTLLLLHWFANIVDIDSNNIIQLTFDPNNDDFGWHYYSNYEQVLDPLPRGYKYYTVGNLLLDKREQLPDYVAHPRAEYAGRNRDRIVFRVRLRNTGRQTWQQIDRVYITQHYGHHRNMTYNPEHTYEITTNLLRQIRKFSVGANQSLRTLRNRYGSNTSDFQLSEIRNIWGNLACLGLLLFIVIEERYNFDQQSASLQSGSTGGNKVVTQPHIPHYNIQGPRQNGWNCETCILILVLICIFVFAILCSLGHSSGRGR